MPRARAVFLILALTAMLIGAGVFLFMRGRGEKTYVPPNLPDEGSLDRYDLVLRLNDGDHTVSITETIRFTNRTGQTLSTIVLRTWLNAFSSEETSPAALEAIYDACYPNGFSPGGLTIFDVNWQGAPVPWEYGNADKTALSLAIPPLQDGESGEIYLRCVAAIPNCAYRLGYVGQDYQLGNLIPLLSRYENGAWRTDLYSPIGDPFVSDCADFDVSLYLPQGFAACGSAVPEQDASGVWRFHIRGARDFCFCLSPAWETARGAAGGVTVTAHAGTKAGAKRALDDGIRALETLNRLYGPYPYPSLTLCCVDFPFSGMEYPGLCMLGEPLFAQDKADTLELTVAHETAHQWFYGLVGSDQANAPWQDEALCEYAMLRYVKERYGQGSFETLKFYRVDSPMRENIPGSLTPGSPIDYFSDLETYRTVVYGRGAALLLALDDLLPEGTDAFLKAYAARFSYGYASREQFEAFLNQYAGMDLRPLLLDYVDTVL
ncbi:MAG: M1 family metallopeptidase [Clostridia bacterium]|nr:M1 family metallopeptidase [Clostridia bacterium]MBR6186876.1 M1 family metallopeptidase [Clostridia bacterium]